MTAAADGDTTRVFLVDDHAVVRAGLAAYLDTEPGMVVVGESSNGRDAINQIAALASTDALPDVVLMDLLMPAMDGIAATAQIKHGWPAVEIIAVTSFLDEDKIRGALQAGATGYLLKNADACDVADAIRAAVAGQMFIDPAAAKALTATLRAPKSPADELTPRERDVIILIATARRTGRSPAASGSPSARPAPTSPTSSQSSVSRAEHRPRCGRSTTAWSRPSPPRRMT